MSTSEKDGAVQKEGGEAGAGGARAAGDPPPPRTATIREIEEMFKRVMARQVRYQ